MTYFSKLGPHIQTDSSGARQWVANSPIIKVVDIDASSIFSAAPSGAILVFRHCINGNCNLPFTAIDGASAADQVISALGMPPQPNLYIEGINEPDLTTDLAGLIQWYTDFTNEAHKKGYKVAGFSISVGNPQPDQVSQMRAANWGGVDTIAVHEYWDNNGPTYQWTALRHRTWWQSGDPPVLITECGRLCIGNYSGANPASCSGYAAGGGWEDFYQTNCQPYLTELDAYSSAIASDAYVLGGTIFTTGGGAAFSSFEIDDVLPCITGGSQPNPNPNPSGTGQCIADPDCIALHGNGYYCQNPGTAQSSCQACPTTTAAGWVLRAQTAPNDTAGYIGAGITVLGAIGLAALAARKG